MELPKQRKERNKQSEIYAILSPLVSCYLSLDLISLFSFFSAVIPPHPTPTLIKCLKHLSFVRRKGKQERTVFKTFLIEITLAKY